MLISTEHVEPQQVTNRIRGQRTIKKNGSQLFTALRTNTGQRICASSISICENPTCVVAAQQYAGRGLCLCYRLQIPHNITI